MSNPASPPLGRPPTPQPGSTPLLTLKVMGQTDCMAALASATAALEWPDCWDAPQRYFVELVLEELLINACTHARRQASDPEVSLRLWSESGLALIEVIDSGPPFDPAQQPAPDLEASVEQRGIGGLGLHLVRHLSDGLVHERIAGRNHVKVWRRGSPA